MKLVFIGWCFISTSCFGQPVAEAPPGPKIDYQIDWKYKAGEYLIFDCERSHFACVNSDGDDNCREERNFAMEKRAGRYPCAPLKKFKDKKSCIEKSYQLVDLNALKRFCYPK